MRQRSQPTDFHQSWKEVLSFAGMQARKGAIAYFKCPKKRSFDVAMGGLNCPKSANKESAVIAERLRRNRMKILCSKLESLLPNAHSRLDRCGLYGEAINYIRKLQEDVSCLKRQRDSLRAKQCGTRVKENEEIRVGVEIYGREAVIVISSLRMPKHLSKIVEALEEHDLDVNMSQLSTGEFFVCVHVHASIRKDIIDVHDPVQLESSLASRLFVAY